MSNLEKKIKVILPCKYFTVGKVYPLVREYKGEVTSVGDHGYYAYIGLQCVEIIKGRR